MKKHVCEVSTPLEGRRSAGNGQIRYGRVRMRLASHWRKWVRPSPWVSNTTMTIVVVSKVCPPCSSDHLWTHRPSNNLTSNSSSSSNRVSNTVWPFSVVTLIFHSQPQLLFPDHLRLCPAHLLNHKHKTFITTCHFQCRCRTIVPFNPPFHSRTSHLWATAYHGCRRHHTHPSEYCHKSGFRLPPRSEGHRTPCS